MKNSNIKNSNIKNIKNIIAIGTASLGAIVLTLALAAPASTNVTPKQPYDSKDAKIDVLTEENLQLKGNSLAQQYQQQIKSLQDQYTAAEQNLDVWIQKVKSDNNWDDSYVYDRQHDKWVRDEKKVKEKERAAEPKK